MIEKEFFTRNEKLMVKVTFSLPDSIWADTIGLVGDFNDWNRTSNPMTRNRQGVWSTAIELDAHRVYQFRYICDNERWMNDNDADAYVRNIYGSDNSVVITEPSYERYAGEGI